jgi:phage portal protein BeeE
VSITGEAPVPEFLPALRARFGLHGRVETKGLAERIRSNGTTYVIPGVAYSHQKWSTRRAVDEGYRPNPLVFRAIEVIANNALARRIVFRRNDPIDGEIVDDINADPTRLLYVLNKRANPWETSKIFRHRLVAQYLLSSKGVFIEVVRTRGGGIALLNLLDPDIVDIIPLERREPGTNRVIETDPIGTYRVMSPGIGPSYLPRYDPTKSAAEQPSSILWVRSPHPTVMWEGMSPTEAAAMSIDLDRYARLYNRRFLQNDGRPGGLISIKGVVGPDTEERIQAQFMGGPNAAGRPAVITADSISYVDTSATPRDMMWDNLQSFTRSDISIAFGVPESVMGDASGRTFDNADAEYEGFWQHRMLPLLQMLDNQLDVLTGGYDDSLFLNHNVDDVWVLGRHKREDQDRAAANVDRGAITMDEYRKVIGEDPLNVPATRVLWLAPGRIPAGASKSDTTDASNLVPVGAGLAANPAAAAQGGAEQGSRIGATLAEDNADATRLRLVSGEDGPASTRYSGGSSWEGEQSRARDEGGYGGGDQWG